MESAQAAKGDVPAVMRVIISGLFRRLITSLPGLISQDDVEGIITNSGAFGALESFLALFSKQLENPLVLMIDEVDSLIGDIRISPPSDQSRVPIRPTNVSSPIILCDVRDLRDYRIHSDREQENITGGVPVT